MPQAAIAVPSVFQFQNQAVRIVMQADEPWFVAADVAKVLEFRDGANLARMCDDDERGYSECEYPRKDGGTFTQKVTTINQPGLFRALTVSRSNRAKPFQRWVFHEVLPQIMKTGTFAVPPVPTFKASPEADGYQLYQDATAWLCKLGAKHGRGAAITMLAQFDAGHLYDLARERLPEFIAACKKVLGTTPNAPATAPALTPQQAEEITQRLDNLARLFHPHSQPFADVMGIVRTLRGLDPKLGARVPSFVPLLPNPAPVAETPLRQQVVQTLRAEYSHGDYKALARDLGIHESSAKKIVGRLKLGASA